MDSTVIFLTVELRDALATDMDSHDELSSHPLKRDGFYVIAYVTAWLLLSKRKLPPLSAIGYMTKTKLLFFVRRYGVPNLKF